ncbi:hypothetical protein [Pontibacter ruber]|uniref:Uncharacterized protein n=1 Tax=Pontibacter ruber TaxID=1343895 RepID=A0ABW5CY03_9BACT|nr:hypothetical protein [Pontibacter ruber]
MANTSKSTGNKSSDKDPCWKGYEQAGMKDKNGKQVPNCIPESKSKSPSSKKKS